MKGLFSNQNKEWKNLNVNDYLERGTVSLEQEDEIDENITWGGDLSIMINAAKITE